MIADLDAAQQRAAEQRLAAEKLLEEARKLEERLAAERALAANVAALEAARAREAEAARELESGTALLADLQRAEQAARAETRRLSDVLAERRADRERAQAALQDVPAALPATRSTGMKLIEELSLLESRIELSSEAAKRVAERRRADASRLAAKARD